LPTTSTYFGGSLLDSRLDDDDNFVRGEWASAKDNEKRGGARLCFPLDSCLRSIKQKAKEANKRGVIVVEALWPTRF
jgi:hypothetical protein